MIVLKRYQTFLSHTVDLMMPPRHRARRAVFEARPGVLSFSSTRTKIRTRVPTTSLAYTATSNFHPRGRAHSSAPPRRGRANPVKERLQAQRRTTRRGAAVPTKPLRLYVPATLADATDFFVRFQEAPRTTPGSWDCHEFRCIRPCCERNFREDTDCRRDRRKQIGG